MRHALLFAAGLGTRMRPLTERTPKPLLPVAGKPLIVWHLEKLAAAGVQNVVINTSHLAMQFPAVLGDGSRWGLHIHYAYEGTSPLETGGGMRQALPYLGDAPFLAISADIWCDYDYARLPKEPAGLAHLVMVPNPSWHADGDFVLHKGRLRLAGVGERLTFGNIGVYRQAFIAAQPTGHFKLLPLYRQAMAAGKLDGERYDGRWYNLGTPVQLAELDAQLCRSERTASP